MNNPFIISLTLTCTILFMVLPACTHHIPDPKLTAIHSTIEENPQKALSDLKAINPSSLDERARHFRNLLIIKASDKAYITHTSDSLFLDVMDYYGAHQEDPYYTEALYYGGRVYSDLGDYPTALDFYRKAAADLPETKSNLKFRATILTHTGFILNRIRLHDEANTCLKEVVDIDRELNDTANLPHDIMTLVSNHIHNNNFSLAKDIIVETLKNESLPEKDRRNLWVFLAVTKYKTGKITEALRIIQNEGKALNNNEESDILSYRAKIYYRAEMLDSAYVMAKRLIRYPEYINKRIGYRILISPKMRSRIPIDSLNYYIDEYSDGMEAYMDENANQAALMQQASYNYSKHARSNEKLLKKYSELKIFLIILLAIVIVSCGAYYMLRIRNKRKFTKLQVKLENITQLRNEEVTALEFKVEEILRLKNKETESLKFQIEKLSKLRDEEVAILRHEIKELSNRKNKEIEALKQNLANLSECQNEKPEEIENKDETYTPNLMPDVHNLREEIREKLNKFIAYKEELPTIPSEILTSGIYSYIQTRLANNKPIPDNNDIWEKIRSVINTTSPEFIKTINKLSEGTLSDVEFQTALLIRLGMQPYQLSVLTGRGRGTIISRRKTISKKILGVEISPQDLTILIRIL